MTDILQEASELINGDRAHTYGPVTDNFQRIADLFAAYLGETDTDELDPYDVANLMILVKLARIKNAGYHRDSYADIAGYAALAEKVFNEKYPLVSRPLTEDFWEGIDASILEAQNAHDASRTSRPEAARIWHHLENVPTDVQVRDSIGDVWTHKLGLWGFTFAGDGHWNDVGEEDLADYDVEDGPYTEVLS